MHRQNLENLIKEEKDSILRSHNKSMAVVIVCLFFFLPAFIFPPSVTSAMTIGKEKEIAEEYMKAIKQSGLIIKDPIIAELISNVGNEIVSTLPPQPFKYSFYGFNVGNFNAFATPGANIFVNRGLIAALDNVDELAGIMAHETAHASFRHVAQLVDKSKIVNIATLAGVLAGILVGSKSDGDLGQGLAMGSLAAGQSAMLTYTRGHEREADQKGFDFITQTGFSPTGLLTGLKKIRAADFYGGDSIPDYLKTHPGTMQRIKSLEIMLARYKNNPNKTKPAKKDYNFDMIKYRILGMNKTSKESDIIFSKLLKKDPDNPAYNYGFAMALAKQLDFDKANIYLQKALKVKLFDPLILLEIGNIDLQKGQPLKAVEVFNGIKDDPAVKTSVAYSLARAQIELENFSEAKTNLLSLIDIPLIPFPKAYYYIAKIYSNEKNPSLTHYYLGHYYAQIKDTKNADIHFRRSLETLTDKQKIEKANSLLKELKKKK